MQQVNKNVARVLTCCKRTNIPVYSGATEPLMVRTLSLASFRCKLWMAAAAPSATHVHSREPTDTRIHAGLSLPS